MSEKSEVVPRYMAHLLEELGWNQGTRIPLANSDNQELESILIARQNEIQQLKEALILQNQKRADLNKYKDYVHSEYQENTRLLFAHKQQLEQEVKLKQLACNEADRLDRDIIDGNKQNKEINARIERSQASIGRLLKKADALKTEVCGERGALQEWRAALERSAGDITAIAQFTKQDLSKAKALETKRQKLKLEHDRMHDRLSELVSNLSAEERACERISVQVMEGMEERKQMLQMWTGAVENLRQRDTDIRHIREDYAVLEAEANKIAEECREQQAFCDLQRGNNNDAARENMGLAQRLSQIRLAYQQIVELNASLHSEVACLQRELSNMRNMLEKLRAENKHIIHEQHRKDVQLQHLATKMKVLKVKLAESTDKSKSSEKRAKELEDMLNEEERYATGVTTNQQRAMHCSFVEQQKLITLKNEEKLLYMQLKASNAIMSKLESKQRVIERTLQGQKEALYAVCYQVETLGSRLLHMEGSKAQRECSSELLEREARLKDVSARHAARVLLLERHSARLMDDMRRLTRELDARSQEHARLQSRLKSSLLGVEGGEKEVKTSREEWRRARVEEALMRLKVAHAARAMAGLDDTAFSLDSQRLQLEAAMNERLVEISARRDMFSVQKRALFEDCGKLRCEIREREQRIDQLKKRYEIFIGSLGKDESGQQLSVTFFKIKFAAERAELRARGAALDGDITRRERDVAALEATLRVVHAAHAHFMRHISPLQEDTPEIVELNELSKQYYAARDELKKLNANIEQLEQLVSDTGSRRTVLVDKGRQLTVRQTEAENDLESDRDRLARLENQLANARKVVKHNAKRAHKLVEGVDDWRFFQMALWVRDYTEAAYNALVAVDQLCESPELHARFAALVSSTDIQRHLGKHQRRMQQYIEQIVADSTEKRTKSYVKVEESIFSSSADSVHSGMSVASGYTKRLSAFRKTLAEKVGEEGLENEPLEHARKSAVSMRVVTLGFEEPADRPTGPTCRTLSRKSLR